MGATFQELYYSNEYGTCPTLTFAGPLAGTRVKLQCNFDNTITYGESRCGADCSCAFEDVYGPGCYRASDALPGTAWFFMTAGCDCTDAKATPTISRDKCQRLQLVDRKPFAGSAAPSAARLQT